LAPMSSPAPSSTVDHASVSSPAKAAKNSAAPSGKLPASDSPDQITLKAEPEVKKSSDAPIRVKPAAPAGKTQPQTEEAAAQPPSPLGVDPSGETNLSGLLSSPDVSKPTLARVKLSQGISQGLLIKRVPPKYPAAALAAHAEGTVQIEATINKEGMVINPKVIKGDRILAGAALEAVRQWRYKPYYLDGEPVEIQTDITINFKAN
jgi:periplasmic protein TonB